MSGWPPAWSFQGFVWLGTILSSVRYDFRLKWSHGRALLGHPPARPPPRLPRPAGRLLWTNASVMTYEHVWNNGNNGTGQVMETWAVEHSEHWTPVGSRR
eukprot:SAG22_NODE_14102_length_384_cov_1.084211_1_plen_100_part_00